MERFSFIDSKIRDILADDYETIKNLYAFKINIEKWKPEKCARRLSKGYIRFYLKKSVNYF